MAEIAYKVESREELQAKIDEEIQILESIFDGEGLVLSKPTVIEASDLDMSTNSSGHGHEEEELFVTQFAV